MRTMLGSWGVVGAMAVLACACGSGAGGDGGRLDLPTRGGGGGGDRGAASSDDGDGDDDALAPEQPETEDVLPNTTPVSEPDADADGVPDAKDCDPLNPAIAGVKLLDDTLANDATKFAPATGFPATSWAYEAEAYRQVRLVDGADATLFTGDAQIADVDIEVGASSTDVGAISPRLRQMFILVGAQAQNGTFTAYGCGAEVVQGMSPEQRTSIVKLEGAPESVTTTALARTPRTILVEGEPYAIRAHVKGGKLTCTVSQGAGVVTTAEAEIGVVRGSIGLFTRQTKAAFKNAKACKLEVPVSNPK